MKKALEYGAGLLALYLAVVYAEGTSKVATSGATGLSGIIAAFQGRSATTSTAVPAITP